MRSAVHSIVPALLLAGVMAGHAAAQGLTRGVGASMTGRNTTVGGGAAVGGIGSNVGAVVGGQPAQALVPLAPEDDEGVANVSLRPLFLVTVEDINPHMQFGMELLLPTPAQRLFDVYFCKRGESQIGCVQGGPRDERRRLTRVTESTPAWTLLQVAPATQRNLSARIGGGTAACYFLLWRSVENAEARESARFTLHNNRPAEDPDCR